ncbi:MAG: Gfo/Idh/MocA family oxidoreductase [Candidatus Lambdaproteobacteria bacterium]|nr:Gfo/Idh/MocA family oxidoreductase [Candidatus Lambdaproteobacteria bacterium]
MAQRPIRIGIIGAGAIVRNRHLPGFSTVEDCRAVVVCNRRRETAEAVAKKWEIPHVVDTPEEVLARDDINAVIVGTYPNLHRALALAAFKHGKHVLVQSRMAYDWADAKAMLAAAKKHPELVNQVCITGRSVPAEGFLTRLVRAGELGELRLVRANALLGDVLDPEAPLHWRFDRELSGSNIGHVGIWNEWLNRIMGPAKTVAATGKVFTARRKDPVTGKLRPVDIPESVCISGEMENGAHYVYTFSGVSAFPPPATLEVYGTRGTLYYDHERQDIRIGRVGKSQALEPVTIPEPEKTRWTVEQDFANAIRKGTPVTPSFADAMAYTMFVEAARRSLDQGKTIRLPLR